MYKVGFIVNGKNRAKSRLYKHLKVSKDAICNLEYNFVETSWQGHASLLAKEFATEGYSHIIAVGGDGTLHEVVNGTLNSGLSPVVGLLPLGSANDFSKTLSCPRKLIEVFDCIEKQSISKIDIGKIKFTSEDNKDEQKFFINISDLGIGADVVQRVNKSSRFLGPTIIFYKAILQSFLSYKNKSLTCKADGWLWSGKLNSFVMANGRYFGNGMCIAPDADPQSRLFQVVIIGDITIYDYLKQVGKIKKGKRIDHPSLEYREASKLKLEAETPCGIEADGEFLGYTPCELNILPKHLNYLVRE